MPVSHNLMLVKLLTRLGILCYDINLEKGWIEGDQLKWLQNYRSNRLISVSLKGVEPKPEFISALDPLLFLIYVNDINNDLECKINILGDDSYL